MTERDWERECIESPSLEKLKLWMEAREVGAGGFLRKREQNPQSEQSGQLLRVYDAA